MVRWPALLLLTVSCASNAPKYSFSLPDLQTKLPNGMRVILLPDPSTDLVEVDVRYEVGSREDPEGKAGLAHLVEHMMFQQKPDGPDTQPLGAIINKSAVYVNAFTNWDSTHYVTLAQSSALETLLALEAARLHTGCDTIDEETFQREREVVRNEIRTRMGAPEAEVSRRVLQAVYPEGHAYRRYIGGDDKELVNITLPDVCKFMSDYYAPERAIVVIAGKVTKEDGEKLASAYLAPLPARKAANRRSVAPIVPQSKTIEIELPVEEPMVVAIWPLPPTHSREGRLASYGLGRVFGATARFGTVYEFTTDVGAGVLGGSEAPVFAMFVSVINEGKIGEAKSALKKAAAAAQRRIEFSKLETQEFHARAIGGRVGSLEALPSRTLTFAEWAQFDPEGGYLGGNLSFTGSVQASDISGVVRQVVDPDRATFIVVRPRKAEKATYERGNLEYAANGNAVDERDRLPIDRTEAARPLTVPSHLSRVKGARSFTLANGMKVLLLPMESMIPMVTVAVEFRAGSAHEPADRAGLARIAAETLSPPPPSNPEEGDPFSRVGIAWGASSDEDSTQFIARGMELYLDVEIKGLERLIKAGEYDQRAIEEEQRLAKVAARRKSASAREHFFLAFNQAMFPSHPYGRMETVASLSKIGRDQAMAWRGDHYTAKNGTIVITGKFDPAKAEAVVRETFGQWSAGKGNAAPAATSLNRGGPTFIAVDGEELPTVEVIIGYPMPAGVNASYGARLVLAEMMTERVASVREKLGASYGVYARQTFRLGPGELTISGPVDAARAGEALKAMRDGVDAMRQGDHFVEDFVRARRDVLRRLVADSTDSRRLATRLLTGSRHGLPPSFDEELIQKVAALTPREVMAVLVDVRPEAEVVALLGAKKFVEKAYQDAGITGVSWK